MVLEYSAVLEDRARRPTSLAGTWIVPARDDEIVPARDVGLHAP
jgi:hypothetical protein